MPNRNIVKTYRSDSYYHIYNRGLNKQNVFIDTADYAVFLNLLKRYLSSEPVKDSKDRQYESLHGQLELLAFCLMPNHFHILIFQKDGEVMTKLLRAISISYTMYFNKKYKRSGPLFQERFKASLIDRDEYLLHISRYIHLNPDQYRTWEFSSLPYYLAEKKAEWIRPERILGLFDAGEYKKFVDDYSENKQIIDEFKSELANSSEL